MAEGRMTTVAACRACGTELLVKARFCHGCGAPVAEADTHAEYKQVTVLFSDVVDSMDIAAAVGAERLREIGLAAMPQITRTLGIATVTRRKRLASKDISRGPRRCRDVA